MSSCLTRHQMHFSKNHGISKYPTWDSPYDIWGMCLDKVLTLGKFSQDTARHGTNKQTIHVGHAACFRYRVKLWRKSSRTRNSSYPNVVKEQDLVLTLPSSCHSSIASQCSSCPCRSPRVSTTSPSCYVTWLHTYANHLSHVSIHLSTWIRSPKRKSIQTPRLALNMHNKDGSPRSWPPWFSQPTLPSFSTQVSPRYQTLVLGCVSYVIQT